MSSLAKSPLYAGCLFLVGFGLFLLLMGFECEVFSVPFLSTTLMGSSFMLLGFAGLLSIQVLSDDLEDAQYRASYRSSRITNLQNRCVEAEALLKRARPFIEADIMMLNVLAKGYGAEPPSKRWLEDYAEYTGEIE